MVNKEYQSIHLACLMQQDGEITQRPINGCLSRTAHGTLKFEQTISAEKRYERNPHLYEGDYVNIGRNKDGELIINMRKIKDSEDTLDPKAFADAVHEELLRVLPTIVNR